MIHKYAPIFVIIAGCSWATMGIFVRTFNKLGIHSLQIVELRAICVVLLFGIFMLIKDKNLFRIKLKDAWCFIGSGCMGVAFFSYCYFETIKVSSLSIAAILLYTAPIFVMILSALLFSEKITRRKIIALILAFSGCFFVSGILDQATGLSLKAFIIGIGSGIGYAMYTIFSKYAMQKGYDSITTTFYTFVVALPLVFLIDARLIASAIADRGIPMIVYMLLFAIVTTVIANVSYLIGLKYIEASKASVMVSIEPVAATMFGFLLFSETPTIFGLAGIAMIIAAITTLNLQMRVAETDESETDKSGTARAGENEA